MIPEFNDDGNLPPGIHQATWGEFALRFGDSALRKTLLGGLYSALRMLFQAGCRTAYVDGSFVTNNLAPRDFDACWDPTGINLQILDPVFLDFSNGRAAQKAKYSGEFFVAGWQELGSGKLFLEFFQVDKNTGKPKGIVAIDLRGL